MADDSVTARLHDAVVHIGTPKTGTTFLQNAMRRAELRGLLHDTCYPLPPGASDQVRIEGGNARPLAELLRPGADRGWEPAHAAERLDALLATRRPDRTVVLSSEDLVFAQHDRFDWLMDALADRGLHARVLCFVRDLQGWTTSSLSLAAKTGSILDDDGSLRRYWDLGPAQGVANLARFATTVSAPVTYLPYRPTSLLRDFAGAIGESADLSVVAPAEPINRRLSRSEFALLQLVRRSEGPDRRFRWIAEHLTAGPALRDDDLIWPPLGRQARNLIDEALELLASAGLADVVEYLAPDAFDVTQNAASAAAESAHPPDMIPTALAAALIEALASAPPATPAPVATSSQPQAGP